MMTFTNGNAAGGASQNPKLKCGAWRATIPAFGGATSTNTYDFASYDDLQAYFRLIQTMIVGLRATSNDPGNFEVGVLQFTERQPDGSEKTVKRPLQKYLQPLGGGSYANEIVIPGTDLSFAFWPGMEVAFNGLKPQSSITFYLQIRGWNKSVELVSLEATSL